MSVRPEGTGKRDLTYSTWHRNELNKYCAAIDIDWVEYRYGKIVCLLEEKSENSPILEHEKRYMVIIGDALDVPVYVFYHNMREGNLPPFKFERVDLRTGQSVMFSEEEWKKWLEQL